VHHVEKGKWSTEATSEGIVVKKLVIPVRSKIMIAVSHELRNEVAEELILI